MHDLHAADALYYQKSSVNFCTGKQIPQAYRNDGSTWNKRGKQQDCDKNSAFEHVMKCLEENEDEQNTIYDDLTEKMAQY